ncbi:MAG TPA: OsmC family peroxiredoxin [Chloroflexota bacterium]|nr:OsmC family peroxiredoxin [Chloroflexota bacterium]
MRNSRADAVWEGSLAKGSGHVSTASGALKSASVSWAARTEAAQSTTSPEELLAAAHASCYTMALSHTLGERGTPPSRLDATAVVAFDQADGGWKVTTAKLSVRGVVPGITQAAFVDAANAAAKGCPVSKALAGVEISVESATLES